jgi:hypothetical protein
MRSLVSFQVNENAMGVGIILNCWTFQWIGVEFDISTGRSRLRRDPKEISGWAHWHLGHWYALWNDNGRLCFQSGQQRWHPDEGWRVTVQTVGRSCIFKIERATEVALERQYRDPKRSWWKKVDASRNQDDEAFDDFFRWVSDTWTNQERQSEMLTRAWKSPRSFLKSET